MWIALSLPILLIFFVGALALYGIIVTFSVGLKIAVYAFIIIFYLIISIVLIWLISLPYRECKTKLSKFFYSVCVSICLLLIIIGLLFSMKTTNITVMNKSPNEIITEIHMIPIGDETNSKETKVFSYNTLGVKIRFTDEMTERCKKIGLQYKKGEEWFYLKENEKDLVCGLWTSEAYTFHVPKGTWIITLKTINRTTGLYYSVIYNQNAFCTHLYENLSFKYSGEEILLTEHQKAQFMPEVIDKHLKKEISQKFTPNLIVITKNAKNVFSGLYISNKSQFFPEIKIGNYDFYCLTPNKTYTANFYITEYRGSEKKEILNEDKEITINNDGTVLYFDQEKKLIKQLQSSGNYTKCKIVE